MYLICVVFRFTQAFYTTTVLQMVLINQYSIKPESLIIYPKCPAVSRQSCLSLITVQSDFRIELDFLNVILMLITKLFHT